MRVFNQNKRKAYARFLIFLMIGQIMVYPAQALTSGPSQPEARSFEPVGTTEMVDLFTGDFTYNIPLFELPGPNGGYPFNLAYQAGIGMDDEASWTGLGWNLNPGAITRQMRGLPDEFNGKDLVHTTMSIEPSITAGVAGGGDLELFGSEAIKTRAGLSIYNNNYRGIGYSIDGSVGFSKAIEGTKAESSVGLGFSLSPDEGIGLQPRAGLNNKIGEFGLTSSYNSKSGLSNISLMYAKPTTRDLKSEKLINGGFAQSASLSFSHPGYIPQINMPMRNTSFNATFKTGAQVFGLFGNAYISGFYNEGRLRDDGKRIASKAYGYLNYHQVAGDNFVMDFNRENDGLVSTETPNLAMPSLTYDIYSVTGQGFSGMFRPFRNEIGIVRDANIESVSNAFAGGGDAGFKHAGVNLSANMSKSTSGEWSGNNLTGNSFQFRDKDINSTFEPWFFKVHGEHSSEKLDNYHKMGGDKAFHVLLTGNDRNSSASQILKTNSATIQAPSFQDLDKSRKVRNQSITPYTNEDILVNGVEELESFKIKYLDSNNSTKTFSRSNFPVHHIAGYTAITPEGLRYNYALPVYNRVHEEVVFSSNTSADNRTEVGNSSGGLPNYKIPGTDKFLKKSELPPYAHSYLLTSVVGPDYIDLTGDGVTEDDLGYWVKFTYRQITSTNDLYKWRDPFSKAHYNQGYRSDYRDDRGSYVYGEKEIWYLATAETKSHIAKFNLKDREDARGAQQKLQDDNLKGKKLKALEEIVMYTRAAGENEPIKKVKLDFDYSLSSGLPNHSQGAGKLTLKELRFEYGKSQRGSLNPYKFTYSQTNPAYHVNAFDRWGNFKPILENDPLRNHDLPYVNQDPANKEILDQFASAWSMTEIQLPSGGKVKVDYEIDDYAYVQHKEAMVMTKSLSPYQNPSTVLNNTYSLDKNNLKIRFPLKRKISTEMDLQAQKREVLKYLDTERGQLYFKLFVNLRSQGEDFFEYISGYADLDMSQAFILEKDASGSYAYGSFYLKKEKGHHPFSIRAWQHIRTNQPELANIAQKLQPTSSTSQKVNQIKALTGLIPHVRQVFQGFNGYCDSKGWGKIIDVDRSVIRLKSPDKVKYGGGLRVKQITMKDQWAYDEEGIYGQVYDYTKEENGQIISSGVAAYEPFIGGDENALRYAKKYSQSIPLRSNNNLFFEYPINESYYPGPQVGYSKVTVMSLPTAYKAGKNVKNVTLSNGKPLFPSGSLSTYGTTGATVHEFYTARDFPVRTFETEKQDVSDKRNIIIPFVGNVAISNLTSSQGYAVITNDMHGKPKKVSQYRQNGSGTIMPDPISWIQYNYFSNDIIYDGEKCNAVTNTFLEDNSGNLVKASDDQPSSNLFALGQEVEFFADMRENSDQSWGLGGNINVDVTWIFIIPSYWPNINKNENRVRTVVTNKIVFQSGILESIEAFDEGSLLTTQNLKWDKETGSVLLTRVNNDFNDPIYNLSIPAYHKYVGMGPSYRNLSYTFYMSNLLTSGETAGHYSFNVQHNVEALFIPGDELLLYHETNGLKSNVGKAIYLGKLNNEHMIFSDKVIPMGNSAGIYAKVIKSGYRNRLDMQAGNISALQDPSANGSAKNYTSKISKPKSLKLN